MEENRSPEESACKNENDENVEEELSVTLDEFLEFQGSHDAFLTQP